MNIRKNLAVFSLLSFASIALSGCDGTVVVAPYPHCDTEPVEVCHNYRDYYGHWHRECGIQYQRHCWNVASAPVGAVTLGNQYALSFDAADSLIGTAVDANNGNLVSAAKLGLTQEDMVKMSNQQPPTEQGIDSVARNLNQDPSAVRDVFTGMMSETQARLNNK